MFTQFHNPPNLHGEILDIYLANGWFRSGQYIYTSKILNFEGELFSPIRIRLPLENYTFRKSLRKIWNKNQKFQTIFHKAFINKEKEDLYKRYKTRLDGYVAKTLKDSLQEGGETTVYDTYEAAVYDDGKLIAVSYFDLGENSIASIKGIFDLEYSSYSLGIYTMLAEIEYGKKNGFKYYYPGYVIPGYPKFDYKLRIGTVDYYKAEFDLWLPFEKMKNEELPSVVIENQIVTMSHALEKAELNHKIYFYPLFDKGYLGNIGELAELKTPIFIKIKNLIFEGEKRNIVIEYDLQKQVFRLGQFHGFGHPIQSYYDATTHKKYDTFRTLLIRELLIAESESVEEIIEEILNL